jgi:radical SAM protein with 4Fe4S-binding SPASM domain
MLTSLQIAVKKLRRIPSDQLLKRSFLGIKKYLTGYPYYITVQTVSACNLKCKHCFINDYHTEIHDGVIKIMKLDEFERFAERLTPLIKHASFFTFSTFEAILNKYLFQMMDRILEINPRMQFPFLSNTMELALDKIRQLERYPISEINISLDGYTKRTVEDFKTEVVFEKIIETIGLLQQSSLRDKLAVTFVAHRNNVQELPDYVDFVARLGIKKIYVSNVLSFTANLAPLTLYSPEGNPGAQALFDEAVQRARQNSISLSMPRLKPEKLGCQATEAFYVDIKGNVAPCDFLGVTTPFTLWGKTTSSPPLFFGNIFKEDAVKIWRKAAAKEFRKAHRLGKQLPSQCVNCIDAYGLMCSNRIHHIA